MYANAKPKPMFTYNNNTSGSGGNIYCDLVLSSCFKQITKILQAYALGDFNYVIQNLDMNDYNALAVGLYKLQNLNYPCYEQIRKSLTSTLTGLRQCVIQTQLLQNLQSQLATYKEGYDILHDNALLKEYIKHLGKHMQLFSGATYTVPTLNIRPEYLEYITLYGVPENLIFDPDKLAQIIAGTNPQHPPSNPNNNVEIEETIDPGTGNIQDTLYNNFEYSALVDDPSDGTFN